MAARPRTPVGAAPSTVQRPSKADWTWSVGKTKPKATRTPATRRPDSQDIGDAVYVEGQLVVNPGSV